MSIVIGAAANLFAQPFVSPIAGVPYQDWTITNYVDLDPSNSIRDYTGATGEKAYTYDSHDGIDIALANFAAMDLGVPVYAAAGGTVTQIRNIYPDRCSRASACDLGTDNYIQIDNGNGVFTEYVHLMRNSMNVHIGQTVTAGQQIALVGSSGKSSDPHLHFTVIQDQNSNGVDGSDPRIETNLSPNTWWNSPVTYSGDNSVSGSLDHGITDHDPDLTANMQRELVDRPADHKVYYQSDGAGQQFWFWTQLHGIDAKDHIDITVKKPDSTVLSPPDFLTPIHDIHYNWRVTPPWTLPNVPDVGTWTINVQLSKWNGTSTDPPTTIATDSFVVLPKATTWQGGFSANWTFAPNWTNGAPNATVDGTRIDNGGPFLTGGTSAQAQDLFLGSGGAGNHGTLDIVYQSGFGAGTLNSRNAYLGNSGQASSTVRVVGPGSTWTNSGNLIVGFQSTGTNTLTIQSGGKVSSARGILGDHFGVTNSSSSVTRTSGTANVDGAGSSWNSGSELRVGNVGVGTLNVTNGGHVTSSVGYVGVWASSLGTATIAGAGSTWSVGGDLYVGSRSIGANTLNVQSGGTVTSGRGFIGDFPSGHGGIIVDGAGSTWNAGSELRIGNLGTGALAIQNGGAVTSSIGRISFAAGSHGAASVSGIGSKWTMTGDLNVGGGGDGALFLGNGGMVSAPLGVTISAGGEVAGNGIIVANNVLNTGLINPGPAVTPGLAASTLNINGNYIQTSAAKLHIDIDTGDYGKLVVNGDITLAGTLDVQIATGLPFWHPEIGDSFQLLSWTGTRTGTFDAVHLPTLSGSQEWKNELYTIGTISVVAKLPGDFNHDGTVDAADYVVWRKGTSVAPSQENYNIWRSHFGQTIGSALASNNDNVPEPGTLFFAVLTAAMLTFFSRRRQAAKNRC